MFECNCKPLCNFIIFFAPEEESQVRFDENAFFNWA